MREKKTIAISNSYATNEAATFHSTSFIMNSVKYNKSN